MVEMVRIYQRRFVNVWIVPKWFQYIEVFFCEKFFIFKSMQINWFGVHVWTSSVTNTAV